MDSHLEWQQSIIRQLARSTMIVCVCKRVSDREIARHARAGMNFDEIQLELGVATQCGRCESCARDVVAQCGGACAVAHIRREDVGIDASQPIAPH